MADKNQRIYLSEEQLDGICYLKELVQKLEKELSALTSSAMKYKSFYSKSASQMAKEAIEASESEAAASRKVRKTTIVESSRQVAAA